MINAHFYLFTHKLRTDRKNAWVTSFFNKISLIACDSSFLYEYWSDVVSESVNFQLITLYYFVKSLYNHFQNYHESGNI